MARARKEKSITNPSTVVIIDFDNISASLKKFLGLSVKDLMVFLNYVCDDLSNLTKLVNRDSRSFNPIILIVSEKENEYERIMQNRFFSAIKEISSTVEVFTIKPKRNNSGLLTSCTDSDVASFLSMALNNREIKRIILFSGDGDFKRVLRWNGTRGKKIELVSVNNTCSNELKEYILLLGGKVSIINSDLISIYKDGDRFRKKGQILGLKKNSKTKKKRLFLQTRELQRKT